VVCFHQTVTLLPAESGNCDDGVLAGCSVGGSGDRANASALPAEGDDGVLVACSVLLAGGDNCADAISVDSSVMSTGSGNCAAADEVLAASLVDSNFFVLLVSILTLMWT